MKVNRKELVHLTKKIHQTRNISWKEARKTAYSLLKEGFDY